MYGLLLALLATTPLATPPGIVRGIYCDPGEALGGQLWADFGAGFEVDAREHHGGGSSLKCANAAATEAHGAVQTVKFASASPRPIVVSGWAKLQGVAGPKDYRCSVYLDLMLEGGESWPMKIATFDPSKAGWQYSEATYTPPKPLVSARVYVFLREREGVAWFDDLSVCQVLDDAGRRGPNLLRDAGFEQAAVGDPALRDAFFAKLTAIGCNAFHFYRSVPWNRVMPERPTDARGPIPAPDPKDRLLDFIRDAHRRGFKVWLTCGVGLPPITLVTSPWHPFWSCVNGPWGEAYTRALAYLAQFGCDGLGVVPDEWNLDNREVEGLSKSKDPEVAKYYAGVPGFCDCPLCRAKFTAGGQAWPDVRRPWSSAEPVWAAYSQFRYDSTSAWIARSVAAVKKVNPAVITDTMICVLPVCSRDRLYTGAAWDQLGVETGLDCLQTDPYIQLHNYRGDSTHWYPTETTLHLAAANQRGWAGTTLEACRLYARYLDKAPVEVYGSALSCLVHGSREFFWWHLNYLQGKSEFVAPEPPSRQLAAVYQVMRALEPAVLSGRESGDVLVGYNRASEDAWDRLEHAKSLPPRAAGPWPAKRGFLAHRNVLHWLLRTGVPFQMTFLDHPDAAKLAAAKVVLVPFASELSPAARQALADLARAGRQVLLLDGPAPDVPGATKLGDEFADGLLEPVRAVRDPQARVPLAPLAAAPTAALTARLDAALGHQASLFATPPVEDVEVVALDTAEGRLVLLINWSLDRPTTVTLRLGPGEASGWSILADATAREVRWTGERIDLAPQEARLVRWSR